SIISKQNQEGSFHLSDTLSEILEIPIDTKSQSFTTTIQKYATREKLKKISTNYTLWTTAITLSYLKLHASSHETIWKIHYEKARKYLSEQIKDVELEEELLKASCKLVEEKTTKKVSSTSETGIISGVSSTLSEVSSTISGVSSTVGGVSSTVGGVSSTVG